MDELTDKQKEFLGYIAQGLNYSDIAKMQGVCHQARSLMADRIQDRLGLCSREELKEYAIQNGYGDSDE